MSSNHHLSRRGFLKSLAVATGAAAGTRLANRVWLPEARADEATGEKSALVAIFLDGGYNSLFSSADSYRNTAFSVTDGNISDLGNGLFVDKGTLGSLPDYAKTHMASIGIRHGISDHETAQPAFFFDGKSNYAVKLAAAMGGGAAIKCAQLGRDLYSPCPRPSEGGVSYQRIDSLDSTIRALGGGPADPNVPARNVAAQALVRAQAMSSGSMGKNPGALVSFKDGYDTGIDLLKKPVKPFNFDQLANAYTGQATGNPTGIASLGTIFNFEGTFSPQEVVNFRTQIIGAELMVRAGANVVTLSQTGWDSHGDRGGVVVRNRFSSLIMAPLVTFLNRIATDPDLQKMNIVVAIFGDVSRSLPQSDHQPNVTATVMGKYVKVGTTGRADARAGLAAGTPGIPQFWAYLAKALKVPTDPFGANPHALVL